MAPHTAKRSNSDALAQILPPQLPIGFDLHRRGPNNQVQNYFIQLAAQGQISRDFADRLFSLFADTYNELHIVPHYAERSPSFHELEELCRSRDNFPLNDTGYLLHSAVRRLADAQYKHSRGDYVQGAAMLESALILLDFHQKSGFSSDFLRNQPLEDLVRSARGYLRLAEVFDTSNLISPQLVPALSDIIEMIGDRRFSVASLKEYFSSSPLALNRANDYSMPEGRLSSVRGIVRALSDVPHHSGNYCHRLRVETLVILNTMAQRVVESLGSERLASLKNENGPVWQVFHTYYFASADQDIDTEQISLALQKEQSALTERLRRQPGDADAFLKREAVFYASRAHTMGLEGDFIQGRVAINLAIACLSKSECCEVPAIEKRLRACIPAKPNSISSRILCDCSQLVLERLDAANQPERASVSDARIFPLFKFVSHGARRTEVAAELQLVLLSAQRLTGVRGMWGDIQAAKVFELSLRPCMDRHQSPDVIDKIVTAFSPAKPGANVFSPGASMARETR